MPKSSQYFADEDYIKEHKPEVVISFGPFKDQIYVSTAYKSSARKIINKIPGTHYVKSQKKFYLPTHLLKTCLNDLSKKSISFAVEKDAGEQLAHFAELREKIISAKEPTTTSKLRSCLLTPIVQKNPNETYSLTSFTAEQLRKLVTGFSTYAERKAYVKELNFTALLRLLINAQAKDIKVWKTQEIDCDIAEFSPELSKSVLADEFILFKDLPLVWTISPDLYPSICFRGEEDLENLNLDKELIRSIDRYEELNFCTLYDSTLVDVYNLYSNLPITYSFEKLLKDINTRQKRLDKIQNYYSKDDTDLNLKNSDLERKLYPHQRIAVSWLLENERAFLGDDMGLGKTLSVLATFDELHKQDKINFLLVICPNSLVYNWQNEIKNWIANYQVSLLPDTKQKREAYLRKIKQGIIKLDGLILNYEEARLPYVTEALEEILRENRVLLCIDESQRIKNHQSKTFKAIDRIKETCKRRVLLSGTPAPKDFSDLWTQVYTLDDGERFGKNYYEWLERVAVLGTKWSRFSIKEFKQLEVAEYLLRFKELLLRRKKTEVVNLPPKIFTRRDLKLTGDQASRYDSIRKDLLVKISSLDGDSFLKQIDNIMEEFLRAVQLASNPRLLDPHWKGESVKFQELDSIVQEVVWEHDEKIVIWTNFRNNVIELVERYKKFNAIPFYGDVPKEKRDRYLKEFQSDAKESPKIIIAIPAAGGVGITLTAASTAVYLDKTWNAEHWLQSIDRVHRIGQTGTVNIISLNACPVDYLISRNLWKKQQMLEEVMDATVLEKERTFPAYDDMIQSLSK